MGRKAPLTIRVVHGAAPDPEAVARGLRLWATFLAGRLPPRGSSLPAPGAAPDSLPGPSPERK
jgi:hypothetical protein